MYFILKSSAGEFTALLQKHQRSLEVLILTSSVSLNLLFREDLVHATSERLFISKWHTEKPENCEGKRWKRLHPPGRGLRFICTAFFDILRAKTGTKVLYLCIYMEKREDVNTASCFFLSFFHSNLPYFIFSEESLYCACDRASNKRGVRAFPAFFLPVFPRFPSARVEFSGQIRI